MAGSQNRFREELTCAICIDLYNDPVTLPCMHSFCKSCLEDHERRGVGYQVVCPECRADIGLGNGRSVNSLPRNHVLANLVSALNDMTPSTAPVSSSAISLRDASAPAQTQQGHPTASTRATATGASPSQNTRGPDPVVSSVYTGATSGREIDDDYSWVEQYEQFLSSTTGGVHHPHVICDGCQGPVYGVRYKCRGCDDYDLCALCEARGTHPNHDMIKVVSPKIIFPQAIYRIPTSVTSNIVCNKCSSTISGVRYHCCQCENFDLCKSCEVKNLHPGHDMRKVVKPKLFRNNIPTRDEARKMKLSGATHPRVVCDGCNCAVRGFRFKCSVCPDYDLCATCLLDKKHVQHDMQKIPAPN